MKKLVAIAVVLVLVTGAAFAQISGTVQTRLRLMDIEDVQADELQAKMYGRIETASITMTGSNEGGTAGGQLRLRAENMTDAYQTKFTFHKAYVWWRPIPQLRIFLGMDPDGLFENAVLAGWQFHQGGEEYMVFQPWDFWRTIFPGNWDTFGLAFSVYPVQGVQLNLVLPTGGPAFNTWPRHEPGNVMREVDYKDMFPFGLIFSGTVSIPDIGRVMFSYIGPKNYKEEETFNYEDFNNYGNFGLSFLLTAVDGFQIQVGVATKIPRYDNIKYPIYTGIAAFYSGSDFGVKFRLGAAINGAATGGNDLFQGKEGDITVIHGSVMPYFNVAGGRLNVDIGVSVNAGDSTDIGWWISPYFTLGPMVAGLQIYAVGGPGYNATIATPDVIKVTIPIMFTFSM